MAKIRHNYVLEVFSTGSSPDFTNKGRIFLDSEYKTKLARALVSMLRPLIRICLRHEVTNAELTELVRLTYVEVAYEQYNIPGIEMTLSRAAVLTGLSRKEVGRLKEALEHSDALVKQSPNRAQRVVHGWLNDEEFTDEKGLPLTLLIKQKKDGKEYGSFVSLVKRYSGDVTYGAILDELNRVGVTEQPDSDTVALVNYGYVPNQDDLEQLRVAATSAADLYGTALHNLDAEAGQKRFQRQVLYSHIDASFVDELQATIATKAQELLETLNTNLAKAKKESDGMPDENLKRIGFGMYYFEGESVRSSPKHKDKKDDKKKD